MNDSEIIKALECCVNNQHCWLCVLKDREDDCHDILKSALDLINRQKAEIERVKKIQQTQADRLVEERAQKYEQIEVISKLKKQLKTAKSVAVREFAENLKRKSELVAPSVWATPYRAVAVADIDKLMEGMGCNDG